MAVSEHLLWLTHPDNYAAAVTPTTTTAHTVYPASNIPLLPITAVWRSTGLLSVTQRFSYDFTTARSIDTIAIVNHNFSSSATITIEAGTTPAYGGFSTTMTWNEGVAFKYLTSAQSFRYWRISVADASNAYGFLEVGYILMGTATVPTFMFRYGWTNGKMIRTSYVSTEFDAPYSEELYRKVFLELDFGPLKTIDMEVLRAMYRTVQRNTYPLLLVPVLSGTDAYFGRIENIFSETVNFRRYVTIKFIGDSFGQIMLHTASGSGSGGGGLLLLPLTQNIG